MNISVDPQIINSMVAEAIVKSAIGEQLKSAIDKAVANLANSYNNPIEQVIRQHIATAAGEILRTSHFDAIRTAVAERLAAKISTNFLDNVVEEAIRRMGP